MQNRLDRLEGQAVNRTGTVFPDGRDMKLRAVSLVNLKMVFRIGFRNPLHVEIAVGLRKNARRRDGCGFRIALHNRQRWDGKTSDRIAVDEGL